MAPGPTCAFTRAVVSLALLQHGTEGEDDLAPARRILAGGPILRVHVPRRGRREFLGEIDADPIRIELRRQAAGLRTQRRDRDRDRILDVDQPGLRIQEPNLASLGLYPNFWRLAAQHGHYGAGVVTHVGDLVGSKANASPPGIAGSEAGENAAWCQRVERGKAVRGDWHNPIRWDQHAGAEPDPIGLHGGGTHRDEDVGAQHLRVIEPGGAEASILRALDGFQESAGVGSAMPKSIYLFS